MGRIILLLAGFYIGGGWLLGSTFGLAPILAYAVGTVVLTILAAAFLLLKTWSPSD